MLFIYRWERVKKLTVVRGIGVSGDNGNRCYGEIKCRRNDGDAFLT